MSSNRINAYFCKRFITPKDPGRKRNYTDGIKIFICLVLYIATIVIQANSPGIQIVNGIVAQLQVMISIYLVVRVYKRGYLIAVSINVLQSLMVARSVIIDGNINSAPGIIIPIGTIITCSIISFYGRRLNDRLHEILAQKEKLALLYENLTDSEEEIRRQNIQLLENNTVLEEKEEKLNYLAYIDVLTELPNRKMIINRLDLLVYLSAKMKQHFAVVFIDLDNFKRINDSKGHYVGDLLLQAVSSRLNTMIYKEDMLGRIGGDEFALIIQHTLKEEEILDYVESLRLALLDLFTIEHSAFRISASFGIAIYPQDGRDSTELLKCADTAMYKAKDSGRNSIQFFYQEMKEEIIKKIEFENALIASLENEELYLVFQPQYTTDLKKLRGFEALTRWQSSKLGAVSPVHFIPVAEETGFIVPMGEWILRSACTIFKCIQETYHQDVIISVNISAVQLSDPSFVQMVKNVLAETKCNGNYLELEVTESVFITSIETVVAVFNDLKTLGIRISLDDFGTGYSSLNYLQKLPIDTLKIDKTFIDTINTVHFNKQIVGSIISLVHKMNISVIAEGVENEVQLDYLKEHHCDSIQGYLWGKPLNEKDLYQLLQKKNPITVQSFFNFK